MVMIVMVLVIMAMIVLVMVGDRNVPTRTALYIAWNLALLRVTARGKHGGGQDSLCFNARHTTT